MCAIEHFIKGETNIIQDAFSIAGDLENYGGKPLDPKWSLLKDSTSNEDSKKDGLLLEMHGGYNEVGDKNVKKPQKAIVEFLCDKERKGDENLYESEDKYPTKKMKRTEEADKTGGEEEKKDEEDKTPSLEFVEYNQNGEIDILRLKWRTKFACEGAKDEKDAETSAGWGFFTWFILMYLPSFWLRNIC